jgi:hypothetical protein
MYIMPRSSRLFCWRAPGKQETDKTGKKRWPETCAAIKKTKAGNNTALKHNSFLRMLYNASA